MKIKFVLGYYKSPLDHSDDLEPVSTWPEIAKSEKVKFTKNQYNFFKLLSLNQDFWEEIKKSRRNINIDEQGWDWPKIKDWFSHDNSLTPGGDAFYRAHRLEEHRIKNIFRLHPLAESQIDKLILGNFVFTQAKDQLITLSLEELTKKDKDFLKEQGVEVVANPNDSEAHASKVLIIKVFEQTSKTDVVNFLRNHLDTFDKLANKLPEIETFSISKRDFTIAKLRQNTNKSFSDISDWLEEHDPDGLTYPEGTVIKANSRCQKKIELTAKRKCDMNSL